MKPKILLRIAAIIMLLHLSGHMVDALTIAFGLHYKTPFCDSNGIRSGFELRGFAFLPD